MRLTILIAALILQGCGRAPVNPVFEPYVQRFNEAAQSQGHALDASWISIEFGDTSSAVTAEDASEELVVDGFCHCDESGCKVTIAQPPIVNWDKESDAFKEALIFHELGHCALQRRHRPDLRADDGAPVSVMFASMPSPDQYLKHHADYIAELFAGPGWNP